MNRPSRPSPSLCTHPGETPEPPDDETDDESAGDDEPQRRSIIKITLADGKERTIQHMMATTFWSPDGTPISAAQFVARLFGALPALFKDEDELRALWGATRYPPRLAPGPG